MLLVLMKKMLTLMLCVSSLFAVFRHVPVSAMRMHPRRNLASIHHTTKYAPNVILLDKSAPVQKTDTITSPSAEDNTADESYDVLYVTDLESVDMNVKDSDIVVLDKSENMDLSADASLDLGVQLKNNEVVDYEATGDQAVDIASIDNLDMSLLTDLKETAQMDATIDFTNSVMDVDIADDEDYVQSLDINDNEVLDGVLELPEGAKSLHLRIHNGNVDLDVLRDTSVNAKKAVQQNKEPSKEAQPKEQLKEQPKEVQEVEVQAASTNFKADAENEDVSYGSKAAFFGGVIGAAVGIVGVIGVAIAKKRASAKSMLSEDVTADAVAAAKVDEDAVSESLCDSESDEDVDASVASHTEEEAVEEKDKNVVEETKKKSVVEGSV